MTNLIKDKDNGSLLMCHVTVFPKWKNVNINRKMLDQNVCKIKGKMKKVIKMKNTMCRLKRCLKQKMNVVPFPYLLICKCYVSDNTKWTLWKNVNVYQSNIILLDNKTTRMMYMYNIKSVSHSDTYLLGKRILEW